MKYLYCLLFSFCISMGFSQSGQRNYLTHNGAGASTVVDLDNDGDLDVVASSKSTDPNVPVLLWYENADGLGTDWITHSIDAAGGILTGVFFDATDVNGDGWHDLVFGSGLTLIHDGNSSNITFTTLLDNGINATSFFRVSDIDGDGDEDIIVPGASNVAFFVHENSGQDGTFDAPDIIYQNGGGGFSVLDLQVTNIYGDNTPEVVIATRSNTSTSFSINVYANIGGGYSTLNFETIYASTFLGGLFELATGNFDSDGATDVAFSQASGSTIIYQFSTFGPWYHSELDPSVLGGNIIAADFDNNSTVDILTSDGNFPSQFNWFSNLDNNNSFMLNSIPSPMEYIADDKWFELGDFDNDGDIDFVTSNWTTSTSYNDGLLLFKNELNTSNTFSDPIKIPGHQDGYLYPLPIDLNNDQHTDLIISSPLDGSIHWLENQGIANQFSIPNPLFPDDFHTTAILGDLDGDGDQDVIAITNTEELIWYENTSVGNVQFAAKQILADNIYTEYLFAVDFDNDGDLDLGAQRASDKAILWFEQSVGNTFTPQVVSDVSTNFQIAGFADMDNDGSVDYIYRDIVNNVNQFRYFKQEPGGTFTSELIYEAAIYTFDIADIDGDLDQDMAFRIGSEIRLLLNDNGVFEEYFITNNANGIRGLQIEDLDNDGKQDIYIGRGWCKQLGDPTNFSELLILDSEAAGFVALTDLSGNGLLDFIYHVDYDELVWAENEINEGAFVEGRLTLDAIENCVVDPIEDTLGIYGWMLNLQRNNETFFTSTNPNGFYSAFVPDSGDYIIHLEKPYNYWGTCFNDSLLLGVGATPVTNVDFIALIAHECPLMQVQISSGLFRPCINGSLSVQYCNEGTVTAEDASVEVLLDELFVFDGASSSFTETDSSYIFEVGDVLAGDCGTIVIQVTPDCNVAAVGDVVCATAYVSPDSLCAPIDSLWDGSTIAVNGECVNDSIHFELKNIGVGDMSEARQFRIEIVNEDIVLMEVVDTFDLSVNEIKMVSLMAELDAVRLEADQDINHPFISTASALVTECAAMELTANLFPIDISDPFADTYCKTITGSYDPNIKEVIAKGYGADNQIDKSWELDYTIHFQNTGNDTAFTVVIVDPISEHLDLSTLRIGAGSHPFVWELNTERELIFTFSNILLPDSTTNEVASHGYLTFAIKPVDNVAFGTKIENKAAIYFDFNDPIITNETSQTIRTPIIASSDHQDICIGVDFQNLTIMNDTLLVDSLLTSEGLYLDFHHIQAIPNQIVYVDTAMTIGTFYNGILIEQDTVVEELLQSINGCDSLTITMISTFVGMEKLAAHFGLELFPQPANETLYVKWDSSLGELNGYSMLSTNGATILEVNNLSSHMTSPVAINIKDLPKGVYWLKVTIGEECVHKKIVKL